MHNPITLLIPEKTDIEFEHVCNAWLQQGRQVKRLGKYWIKDEALVTQPIAIYGNQAFAYVLAQIYNVQLISPTDSLLAELDKLWTKRNIKLKQVYQLAPADFPTFVKPLIPKLFPPGIYATFANFRQVIKGVQENDEILLSSIIGDITAEARSYVLAGEIKDIALYEGDRPLGPGLLFLRAFIAENRPLIPHAVVIDIAYSQSIGWFILEFNACWGAGLNNCKAENIIDCIAAATVNGGGNTL